MGKDQFRKTHPYTIVRHLKLSVIVVIISVLQQLFNRPEGILDLIGSLGLNVLYVLFFIFYAVMLYGSMKYRLESGGVHIKSGIMIRNNCVIPYSSVRTVVFCRDVISSLFGAERVSLDTPAGSRKKYDVTAYFSFLKVRAFKDMLAKKEDRSAEYHSRIMGVILMSAFWSNPITGLVFIVPVIYKSSQLLGREITESMVIGSISSQWDFIADVLSPAVATLGAIIILSWALSMLLCFLRYVRFISYRAGDYIVTARGLLSRSTTYTKISGISSVSIDQSLFMKLLHLESCSMTVIGSGKLKGDKGLIISPESSGTVKRKVSDLTGFTFTERKKISVARRSVWSYIYLPVLVMVPIAAFLIYRLIIPSMRETGLLLAVIMGLLDIWWLLFRIFSYRHAYMGLTDSHLIVCSYQNLTLKKHYIPFSMIQSIRIEQNIFQKMRGKCNVNVSIFAEKRTLCKVKQLPLSEVEELTAHLRLGVVHPAS